MLIFGRPTISQIQGSGWVDIGYYGLPMAERDIYDTVTITVLSEGVTVEYSSTRNIAASHFVKVTGGTALTEDSGILESVEMAIIENTATCRRESSEPIPIHDEMPGPDVPVSVYRLNDGTLACIAISEHFYYKRIKFDPDAANVSRMVIDHESVRIINEFAGRVAIVRDSPFDRFMVRASVGGSGILVLQLILKDGSAANR